MARLVLVVILTVGLMKTAHAAGGAESGPVKDTCSADPDDQACKLLRGLKKTDTLEFANGFTLPACALSSIERTENDAKDEDRRIHQSKLADALASAKPGTITDTEQSSLLNGNGSENFFAEGELKIYWPPSAKFDDQKRTTMTAEAFRAYYQNALGKPAFERLVAAYREEKLKNANSPGYQPRPQFEINEETEQRKSRVFNQAKEALEKFLLRGRIPSQLSVEEKNMLARMNSVNLRQAPRAGTADCGPAFPAFYDYGKGDVGFPPGMMFHTDESLFRAMVHELSHSIDDCRMSEKQKAGGNQPAIDPQKHPHIAINKCLLFEKKSAFGAVGGTDPLSSEHACDHNKHLEGYCDWMAAEVMAAEIKRGALGKVVAQPMKRVGGEPVNTKRIKIPKGFENIFYQLDNACSETAADPRASHPAWTDRINHIMLRKQELRAAMGCAPSADAGCRLPLPASKPGAVNAPATAR